MIALEKNPSRNDRISHEGPVRYFKRMREEHGVFVVRLRTDSDSNAVACNIPAGWIQSNTSMRGRILLTVGHLVFAAAHRCAERRGGGAWLRKSPHRRVVEVAGILGHVGSKRA